MLSRHGWRMIVGMFAFSALAGGCDQLPTGNPLDPAVPTVGSADDGTIPNVSDAYIQVFFSQVDGKSAANKANPNNIAAHCAAFIRSAKSTLDICCHEIDNRVIVEAIVDAQFRGVKVRVITETDYLKEVGPLAFEQAGIPMISDRRSALMHQKFVVVDSSMVWTGSFNFTENCAYKNNNNGIIINNVRVANNYSAWYDWFWNIGSRQQQRRGGPTPYPDVELADGSHVEARFTSFDVMDNSIVEVIREAKKSIKFLAFSFTQRSIHRAMMERASQGVRVIGIFEQRQLQTSRYNDFLGKPNCFVYPDRNPYNMHHKVIIVDDQVVVTGSYNFSENAATANDENYVMIWKNKPVAAQFLQEFDKILMQATANGGEANGVKQASDFIR